MKVKVTFKNKQLGKKSYVVEMRNIYVLYDIFERAHWQEDLVGLIKEKYGVDPEEKYYIQGIQDIDKD